MLNKTNSNRKKFDIYYSLLKLNHNDSSKYNKWITEAWNIANDLKNDTLILTLHFLESKMAGNIGDKRIKHLLIAIKVAEKLNDSLNIAKANFGMGTFYFWNQNIDLSIKYIKESIKYHPATADPLEKATYLMSYGVVVQNINLQEAIKYHEDALKIKRKADAWELIPISLNNLAELKLELNDTINALELLDEAILISKKHNVTAALIYATFIKGQILINQKNYEKAIPPIEFAVSWWEDNGYLKDLPRAYEYMAVAYKNTGNNTSAMLTLEKLINVKDSIFKLDQQQSIQELETKYQTEKKELEIEKQKQEAIVAKKSERMQLIVFSVIAFLLIINTLYFFNRYKKQKRDKETIADQKILLEVKNKEVEDSITYAKRIQNAILPPQKKVKEHLEESFILYKPKDIVAGDFYWLETIDNIETEQSDKNPTPNSQHPSLVLFAAADCTGHGVPGAMVSVVCNYGLNRAVREFGLTDPGEILNKTREIVVSEFEKSEDKVKDGMDIALCSLSVNSNQSTVLKYAGAHNPLWIISKNQLSEIKANKQPIGKFDNPEPYTTHTLELQKGDTFYIFSDGYADQFGGEKGKKFKTSNLKSLLLSIQDKTMEEQKHLVDDAFENWKDDLEQLDDVCMIGVRI